MHHNLRQRVLHVAVTAVVAGCVAALAFAVSNPALAMTAVPAINYGETNASLIQEVGKKGHHKHHGDYRRHYDYGYYRRPYYDFYYRPPYYGYGYRPHVYGGYGYGYPYYGRSGVSVWFDF